MISLPLGGLKLTNLRPDSCSPSSLSDTLDSLTETPSITPSIAEAVPGLFIGDYAAACNENLLKKHEIDIIVNCVESLPNKFKTSFVYCDLPLEDNPAINFDTNLHNLVDTVHGYIDSGKTVLIHCRKGISRAPTVAIGYMIKYHGFSFDQAFEELRSKDPKIDPNIGLIAQLEKI